MFVALEKLYRDGEKFPPQWPPLVGQLRSYRDDTGGRNCLKLWPLDWIESAPQRWEPSGVLWLPEFVGIGSSFFLLRGLEEVRGRSGRAWAFQKWRCEVLPREQAMNYLRPDPRFGPLPASIR